MIRYINTKQDNEVETIDQLDSNDFSSYRDFKKELLRLVNEYRLCFNQLVYTSQRSTKAWNN